MFRRAMAPRTYTDAIEALNSLQTNFSIIDAIRKSGGKSNKDAIPQMLEWASRSGYPDPKVFDKLNIIHVTGTKGKGSTCAFVQSILNQYKGNGSGITKVGLYTSPHLKSVRERIRIDGQPIDEDKFVKYFFELWDQLESTKSNEVDFPDMIPGVKPVYFRYLTLLSFHIFLKEGVDTAIYEVGIGGEYDSTNIIVNPTATGVSSLGLDHTNILGNTIEEIAWNKSGIFKKGVPALTIPQAEEGATKVLKERALEKSGTELSIVPVHPLIANGSIKLGLAGEFQKTNASLAIGLVKEHLHKLGVDNNQLPTSDTLPEKFLTGLEQASWPGRCQTLKQGTITYNLDGAHTQESITEAGKWYVSQVQEEKNTQNPVKHRVLLFNQQNRDANALVKTLHAVLSAGDVKFDHVIFTTNVTRKAGYSADLTSFNTSKEAVDELVVQKALSNAWEQIDNSAQRHVFSNIGDSVKFIKTLGGETSVLVTGSLILVGGFLAIVEDN